MTSQAPPSPVDLQGIRNACELRVASLEADTEKCFSSASPGFAYFPPVLYAFATLDYFSSHWKGWNKPGHRKKQTDRMVEFAKQFLQYGSKEAQVAVNIWRHKLMHTAEPRALKDLRTGERYVWETGPDATNHMKLVRTENVGEFRLNFAPKQFCSELRSAIFGPNGYFSQLEHCPDLQQKWNCCEYEFNSETITIML